ncbi:MAG: hypothetical protein H6742_03135 [Alphaproteobacteria bacterium]|nr:hypothetical protein [Alphaproteobacteria bacterium]
MPIFAVLLAVLPAPAAANPGPAPTGDAVLYAVGPGWRVQLDEGWQVEEEGGVDGGALRAHRGEEQLSVSVELLPWGEAPPTGLAPTATIPLCGDRVPAEVSPAPGAAHIRLALDRAGMRLTLDHLGPALPTIVCPSDLGSLDLRERPCMASSPSAVGACMQRERERRCEVRCILDTADLEACPRQCTRVPRP